MARVVESATFLYSRASRLFVRCIAPLLVVGAIVTLGACANEKGGTSSLGASDKVGSAANGDCIVDYIHDNYCGPYAKQWCKDHPFQAPTQGSCVGVRGWLLEGSNGASAGSSPGSSSNPSPSGATPGGGSNSGSSGSNSNTQCTPGAGGCDPYGHRIVCDPVDPHYPCYDNTTGALRTGGPNSSSSGSGSPGSSSGGSGPSGGSPNGSSGSQSSGSSNGSSGSQNSGSPNSGSNSGTNYGPGNGYVP
jgi:hypothetical protein